MRPWLAAADALLWILHSHGTGVAALFVFFVGIIDVVSGILVDFLSLDSFALVPSSRASHLASHRIILHNKPAFYTHSVLCFPWSIITTPLHRLQHCSLNH